MSQDIFAERRFELGPDEIIARFYAPTLEPAGEYKCRITISWPDRERQSHACGIDGVQALMLAMRLVHSELIHSDAYREGRLTYLHQKDLDLPPSWGAGPLYDVGPEPQ